jgi:glycosyltransferase involved in cell wall biosynthesis
MLKVSLVCTLKNEKENIDSFVKSLLEQTLIPDEVVIVDGGSSDGTTDIIRNYFGVLPIKLIISQNVNIAKGRNIAIKNARNEVVAITDAGCKLDPDWLKNIVQPLEENPNIDVVSGFYRPWIMSDFEEIVSYFLFFPKENKTKVEYFLPSGRSIAFKKSVWERVGGYPELLDTAEDTVFDLNLKNKGANFALADKAIVYWRIRSKLSSVFKQYYGYAKGDGTAFLFPLRYVPPYAFVALLGFVILLGYGNAYSFFATFVFVIFAFWFRYFRKIKKLSLRRLILGFSIALAMEFGSSIGFVAGLIKKLTL